MLQIAVCDDSPALLERICGLLQKNTPHTIHAFPSGTALLKALAHSDGFHLAFLDVDMPERNGIETAKALLEISPHTRIVFLTSHAQYAVAAINEVHPDGYLLKDFSDPTQFATSFLNMLHQLERQLQNEQSICVRVREESSDIAGEFEEHTEIIPVADLLFIEALGNQSCLYLKDRIIINQTPLKTWSEHPALPQTEFFRSDKSFLVALRAVSTYTRSEISICGRPEKARLSTRKAAGFKQALLAYTTRHLI